jgi:hypothetical protein
MAAPKLTQNRSARNALTVDFIRAALSYDKRSGVLRWKVRSDARRCWNVRHAGNVAGCIDDKGYRKISVNGCLVSAHLLIWFYITGEWPEHEIDHANGNRSDNRWSNIRLATPSQNRWNSRKSTRNTSGFKGVYWCEVMNAWSAQICAGGKRTYLGCFKTARMAHAAYCDAANRLHGKFARHN